MGFRGRYRFRFILLSCSSLRLGATGGRMPEYFNDAFGYPSTSAERATGQAWDPVVLWSRPEEERQGTALLVMFHGHLANEEDLMGLVDHLPADLTVASVRAPTPRDPDSPGFPSARTPGIRWTWSPNRSHGWSPGWTR